MGLVSSYRRPRLSVSRSAISVQRQIARALVLTASYVGSSSRNLPRSYNINGAYLGDPRTEQQLRSKSCDRRGRVRTGPPMVNPY